MEGEGNVKNVKMLKTDLYSAIKSEDSEALEIQKGEEKGRVQRKGKVEKEWKWEWESVSTAS